MKPLLICLLLLIYHLFLTGPVAVAQTSSSSSLSTEINDDDKTYSIKIDGDRNGKSVHYNRTFSVAGMTKAQKQTIMNRVLDSLGLGESPPQPQQPAGALTAAPVKVTFVCSTCMGRAKLSINGSGFSVERDIVIGKDKPGFPFELDLPPGEYQYTYWQNRVEQMRLPFRVKAGEQNVVTVK